METEQKVTDTINNMPALFAFQLINFILRISEVIFLEKLHIKKYNNLYSFCFYLCQNYLDIASNNTLFSS